MGEMRIPPAALALSLILLVAGCDFFSEPKSDFRERATEQLRLKELLWDSLAIHDYDFNYVKFCDCPSATPGAVRIEVRGDAVSRVTDDLGTEITSQTAKQWPTVDSLFARARAVLGDHSVTATIFFDTAYYFPMFIQSSRQSSGDLVRHTAGGLTPITP